MQFVAHNSKVEVNGQTVLSVLGGMRTMRSLGLSILRDSGIVDPQPGEWYLQQDWLNAFKKIAETIGPNTLRSIGEAIPENADFPKEIDNIDKALASIEVAYHMNHRLHGRPLFDPSTGTFIHEIGHYAYQKTGEKTAKVVCDNPYPCDFDRGIIESMAKTFKPQGSLFVWVEHDTGHGCRKNGDPDCSYLVRW